VTTVQILLSFEVTSVPPLVGCLTIGGTSVCGSTGIDA